VQDELTEESINFLLTSPALIKFYDEIKRDSRAKPNLIVTWLKGNYSAALNERGLTFENPLITARQLAHLLNCITDKSISTQIAKDIFTTLLLDPKQPIGDLVKQIKSQQTNDDDLIETTIKQIIARHPKQVSDYLAGKEKLLGFFVGQVMTELKGKVDAAHVSLLLRQHLH
jgi:aspartyl-tRNA(Asn)/glutamyl-tRNA(Gln) amidotransferase subunit B